MRSGVAWQRSEQDVSPVLIVRLVCHLWLEALAGEVPIQQSRGELWPQTACTVGPPISISRGPCSIAQMTLSAMDSGENKGGIGCACCGSLLRWRTACGVFTAGSCSMQSRTALPSWMSSVRSESVNPRTAAFAAQ